MKFCSACGAEIIVKIPASDNRPRHVCSSCGKIHYQNPRIVSGCIPVWESQILLCKRAIEPRYGFWTLPAGFMELGETTPEAALRETLEEANARVELQGLYAVMNLPHVDQVYMMFRSRLLDTDFSPGEESLELRLYSEEDIPWDSLAFSSIRHTLQLYFQDQKSGQYKVHVGDIVKQGKSYQFRSEDGAPVPV